MNSVKNASLNIMATSPKTIVSPFVSIATGCNPIITVKKNGDKFIIFMLIKASNSFVKIYDSVLLTC